MAQTHGAARQIILAALGLAAQRRWREVALLDIAAAANVPLAQLYDVFPSKQAILNAFQHDLDEIVLAGTGARQPGESPRDRLFDILMRRFELLEPHRAAIRSILGNAAGDPVAICAGLGQLGRSMAMMLEGAGIPSDGVAGCLRVNGLAAVYAFVLRVWLGDDSPDKSRTMAALDRKLRWAERWSGLGRRGGHRSGFSAAPGGRASR